VWTMIAMVPLMQACSNDGGQGAKSDGKAAPKSTEKIKLTWSIVANPNLLARYQDFTKTYNEKHPNVEWELRPIPYAEYESKIITQLSGGTAPDVFFTGGWMIGKLIANQSVTELSAFMKAPDSKIKESDFIEGVWGSAKKDGKIYAITVDCN